MTGKIGALLIALISGIISLALAVEQVFYFEIPTMNYIYAEVVLWLISVVCIGIGVILGEWEKEEHEYLYEYSGEEIKIRSAEALAETERNEQARLAVVKKFGRFNRRKLIYKGESDCRQ